MSPRTGRPKSDNPKTNRITIRLDDITYSQLVDYCTKENVDKAEAIRKGIQKLVDNK